MVTVGDKTRNPGGVAGRLSGEKTGGLSGGKKIYFVYNGGNRKMRGGPNKIEKRGEIEKIEKRGGIENIEKRGRTNKKIEKRGETKKNRKNRGD